MLIKFKMIWQSAFYNFRLWKGNQRIATTFILNFILCYLLTDKLIVFSIEHKTTLQLVESFIWTFGDSHSILLISLLLILLFSDVPFITSATPYFLIRGNRKIWILGQLVYIFLSTLVYLMFTLLSTCLLCMKFSFIKNSWSRTAAILAYSDEGEEILLPATVKILEMSRPYLAMVYIFLLMLLYTLVMTFIMLVLCLWRGQMIAIIGTLGFSAFGVLLNAENIQALLHLPDVLYYKAKVLVGWISPLNHATYHMHNFGYDKLPTLWQTFVILGSLLLVLIMLANILLKKYSFEFRGMER